MSFDCNGNDTNDVIQQKCMNETPELITIDDDEDDEYSCDDSIDETDDIEFIEEIDGNSNSVTALDSSLLSDTKEVETELKTNETIGEQKTEYINESLSCDKSKEVVTNDQKNGLKCPKRMKPTTIPSHPSTSAAVRSPDSSSDEKPTKVQRIIDPKVAENSHSMDESPAMNASTSVSRPKPDIETLFKNYLKAFRDQTIELKSNETVVKECVQIIEGIYLKLKETNLVFLKSKQFSKLLEVFTKEMLEFKTEREVFRHHNDLKLELKRLAQNTDYKETIKIKNRGKKIINLTETILRLQQQIFTAENEELDYESMENNSCFTDLPKLYRKVHEVWTKREELLKRSTSTGNAMFKKYKCNSTSYPEINKCVENLFTNYLKKFKNKSRGYVDESFTFIDVRKAILDVIKDNNLVVMNCESMIETVYKDLLNEKRNRREKDTEELFETLETTDDLKPKSFIESDPLLELELIKNKKGCDDKIQALLEKYANEDRKKNGDSVLIDGSNEWDTDLVNNDEEFESLDVKDGELDDDNNEESDDEPILEISDNEAKQSSDEDIDSIDMSSDEILIISQN